MNDASEQILTDRELLERAAKAMGGISFLFYDELFGLVIDEDGDTHWNPLDDDGDALRLASLLAIDIDFDFGADDEPETVEAYRKRENGEYEVFNEDIQPNTSSAAAVRRAIVRAAAEIGRQP